MKGTPEDTPFMKLNKMSMMSSGGVIVGAFSFFVFNFMTSP